MRSLIGFCSLLSIAAPVAAQTAVVQSAPFAAAESQNRVLMVMPPTSSACPADVSANRLPGGGFLNARPAADGQQSMRARIGLRVSVAPALFRDARAFTQAKFTVHGTAGGSYMLVGSGGGAASESFSLAAAAGMRDATLHTTVYMHRLTGVRSIELNELTYADGSTWHEPSPGACTFAPNGFMPVTASR